MQLHAKNFQSAVVFAGSKCKADHAKYGVNMQQSNGTSLVARDFTDSEFSLY